MYTSSDQSLLTIHNDLNGYMYDVNGNKIKLSSGAEKRIPLINTLNGYYDPNISQDTSKTPNMTTREDNQYTNSDLLYELIRQISALNTKFGGIENALNNINANLRNIDTNTSNINTNLNALAYNQLGVRTSDCITNISEDTDNLSNIYNKLEAITGSGDAGEFLKCGTNY